MKKVIALLLCLTLFLNFSYSQKWGAAGARWKMNQDNPSQPPNFGGEIYNYDTLFNGRQCTRTMGVFGSYISYLANDTVYFYIDGRFRPALYFSAQVGDTLSYYYHNSRRAEDSIVTTVVDSIYYERYPNDSLMTFTLRILSPDTVYSLWPGGDKKLRYSEKLGFTASHSFYDVFGVYAPFIFMNPGSIDNSVEHICNYGDSSIRGFWLHADTFCLPSVIADFSPEPSVSVYPCPAIGNLHIRSIFAYELFKICDETGRVASEGKPTEELDIRRLCPGIYFLELTDSRGHHAFKMFLKE